MIPSPIVSIGFGPNPRLMTLGHSPIITVIEAVREVIGGARIKSKQIIENIPDLFYHVRAGLVRVGENIVHPPLTGEDKKVYSSSEDGVTVYASLDNKDIKDSVNRIFINASIKASKKK